MRIHQDQAPHRQRVESSSLTSVGYETGSRTLEVAFRKGGVYRYFGVPASVHEALMEAPSKGRFFVAQVRDCFPFARVFQ